MATPNPAGAARFGVRRLDAAFLTASSLAVRTPAVAKRVGREQAHCMKAAASCGDARGYHTDPSAPLFPALVKNRASGYRLLSCGFSQLESTSSILSSTSHRAWLRSNPRISSLS